MPRSADYFRIRPAESSILSMSTETRWLVTWPDVNRKMSRALYVRVIPNSQCTVEPGLDLLHVGRPHGRCFNVGNTGTIYGRVDHEACRTRRWPRRICSAQQGRALRADPAAPGRAPLRAKQGPLGVGCCADADRRCARRLAHTGARRPHRDHPGGRMRSTRRWNSSRSACCWRWVSARWLVPPDIRQQRSAVKKRRRTSAAGAPVRGEPQS